MKAYRVAGTFLMGGKRQPFTKEVTADDEDSAMEWVYSVFGSRHRAKRREVTIAEVVEISEEELASRRRRPGAEEEE